MKKIKLTQGKVAVVDNKHYNWLNQYNWCAGKYCNNYYAMRSDRTTGKKRILLMHRLILGLGFGDKRHTDYRNHNGLDNREHNIKVCNHSQNQFNRKNVKGYTWDKCRKKWCAQIVFNYKHYHLGYFNNKKDAHKAYLKAKKKILEKIND